MPISDDQTDLQFAAFLSYARADGAVAKRIQKAIETYRLPATVSGSSGRPGGDGNSGRPGGDGSFGRPGGDGDPRRVGRIFRDRDDFAAASSLTDAIRDALARSRALIVLCSPDARASQWVAAEIAVFRELHPAAPIFAVLVRGTPQEAMPDALLADGREPLAADLRSDGDGWRLALLKLVAALVGTPLDTLIQRDAQRQLRRVTAVTALAALVALVMMGMTAAAISARNEARAQRAQAEGLVDFMLTDLRTRLRGVGNIDVMNAVNDRAMGYYGSQGDLSQLPATSLEQRARILHAMGEDDLARERTAAALARFTEAHRTTAALLDADPDDPDRIFAHAQSEYWLGAYFLGKGEHAPAQARLLAYHALAVRLGAREPRTPRALKELAYAEGNLCAVAYLRLPLTPVAINHCRAALGAMQRLRVQRPGDREILLAVANRHGWLAHALSDTCLFG